MIEVDHVSMMYGNFQAVRDCSFSVGKGEIVGLLGPNGAGKTTIMKVITTQICPTSGTCRVADFDCLKDPKEVRRHVGYLPEQAPLYDDMEVREYLDFVAKGRGLKGKRLRERIDWAKDRCGLEKVWCKPIGELSKGYRQRVGLAQALVHDPPCLVLDEPTSGLDPLQIIEIRSLIKDLAKDKAILYSSHIIQEIVALSDRVVIINDGEIRVQGTLQDLTQKVEPTEGEGLSIEDLARAQSYLETMFTTLLHRN